MRVCILATDENVETVRATAKNNVPQLADLPVLTIPVSATGEMPVTHWFCNFLVSEETYTKLQEIKVLSEMEVTSTNNFLKDRNLKIIKRRH
jgi:hypothetical protein